MRRKFPGGGAAAGTHLLTDRQMFRGSTTHPQTWRSCETCDTQGQKPERRTPPVIPFIRRSRRSKRASLRVDRGPGDSSRVQGFSLR